MKHARTIAAAVIVVSLSAFSANGGALLGGIAKPNPPFDQKTGNYMPVAEKRAESQILVRFDNSLSSIEIETINKKLGAKIVNVMSEGNLMLVEIAYPNIRPQIIEAYSATDGVVYAEPNAVVRIPETPDQIDKAGDAAIPDSPLIGLPNVSD